jgi:DNA-binding NtrC family response regulator
MAPQATRPLSGQTILIVDDEELVRDALCMLVQENGAEALAAGDGADALEVLRSAPNLTCAIIDYSMPEQNGYELYLAVEKDRPGLPVVIISGLSIVGEVSALNDAGKLVFLPKPFGEIDLVRAIRRALALGKSVEANPA